MPTTVTGLSEVWFVLLGSNSRRAFGLMSVDEIMKNNSNRKKMSVMDDMLKFGLILLLRWMAMRIIF